MIMASPNNPFAQYKHYSEVTFMLNEAQVPIIEAGFEDLALSTACFETDRNSKQWRCRMVIPSDQADEVGRLLAVLREVHEVELPEPTIDALEEKDWVSHVQASFKPMRAGRFYIYGTHIDENPPEDATPIIMNAGAAFGTGEHETTSGCLQAIDRLCAERSFIRPLDMGCGTGILAIAMAKVLNVPVLGVDNDAVSVEVATRNGELNEVSGLTSFYCGDGYQCDQVEGEYDLIVANILAKPLVSMAKDLKRHLASDGRVVLSGLLSDQAPMVLQAHETQGLKLIDRIDIGPWSTLVLS